MKICIYGASSDSIDNIYFDGVYKLGEALAKRNHTLVFGGGAHGLMGAAVKSFNNESGNTIGISPKFFDMDDILYKNCDEFIYTETMSERKQLLAQMSDAFIAVPGGIGTFDEFFEILTLKQLSMHNKPIVIFNINGYFDTLLAFLKETVEKGFMKEVCLELFKVCDDCESVIDYIENYNDTFPSLEFIKYDKKM